MLEGLPDTEDELNGVASIVRPSLEPRYCPGIRFSEQDKAFIGKYLDNAAPRVPDECYNSDEVPRRAFFHRGNPKTIPDFVNVHARLALCPEARALIEEFEPGVHRFFPVEIARKRSARPIYRLDGRVLDTPYYLFIPQVFLDAVWVERSTVMVGPSWGEPPLVTPRPGGDKIVLRRDIVRGHQVWRGWRHLPARVFFSDELVRAVEARKLRKLECTHLEEA